MKNRYRSRHSSGSMAGQGVVSTKRRRKGMHRRVKWTRLRVGVSVRVSERGGVSAEKGPSAAAS